MPIIENLKILLDHIYHTADRRIPCLADQFFLRLVNAYSECGSIEGLTIPIPIDLTMWDEIRGRLGAIKSYAIAEKDQELERLIRDFEKEAKKRDKALKEATYILTPESIPHYLELTNINPNTFGNKIKQFWSKIDSQEYQQDQLKKRPFDLKHGNISRQVVDHVMKYLSSNISLIEECGDPRANALRNEFDALKAAISQYYRYKTDKFLADKNGFSHSRMFALEDFEHCSLCWRFVPKRPKGDNKKSYCDIHSYDSSTPGPRTEYNLALAFNHNSPGRGEDIKNRGGLLFPGRTAELYSVLHEQFPITDGGISRQEWHNALCGKLSAVDFYSFPEIEYDLEQLWAICPHVQRFIRDQKGNDKSPESILEILDPVTPDEPEAFQNERKYLHKFLSKNFALYRLELAMAESYLADYYEYKDNNPKGGKRPGANRKYSGGAQIPEGG